MLQFNCVKYKYTVFLCGKKDVMINNERPTNRQLEPFYVAMHLIKYPVPIQINNYFQNVNLCFFFVLKNY